MQTLSQLISLFRRFRGQPVDLERLLQQPEMYRAEFTKQSVSVNAESVIRWHDFGRNSRPHDHQLSVGQLRGWRFENGHYAGAVYDVPELISFANTDTRMVVLDISDVFGLTASKSDLSRYQTLQEFAADRCEALTANPSEQSLQKNLSHNEIRIFDPDTHDFFLRYAWDGRIWLRNAGGSHHFAAAKHIAEKIGVAVPLPGRLVTQSINLSALGSLEARFSGFLVTSEPSHLEAIKSAVRATKASYCSMPEDMQHPQSAVLLFPRSEARSIRVAQVFEKAVFVDVFKTLREIAETNSDF